MIRRTRTVSWALVFVLAGAVSGCPFDIEPVAQGAGDAGDATGGAPSDASTGAGGASTAGTGGSASPFDGGSAPDVETCVGCNAATCRCLPSLPSGWKHVALVETNDGTSVPCPDGFESGAQLGRGAVDEGCSACRCEQPTAGPCEPYVMGNSACRGEHPVGGFGQIVVGQCRRNVHGATMNHAVVRTGGAGTLQLFDPECGEPETDPLPPRFETTLTVCEADAPPGCSDGECVPVPLSPFGASACVLAPQEGNVSCPEGYPRKLIYETGFDDSRSCDGCSCQPDTFCTGGRVEYCADEDCSSGCEVVDSDVCHVGRPGSVKMLSLPTPPDDACRVVGTPTTSGTLTARGMRVLCCS